MSVLAPLFLAGAAAIGLPILAHLIRRRPRGQVTFSSLMFLRTSPPRLTRRSRLDHWPLLLIRTLVILLLAAAFSRPFWRTSAEADADVLGRRVVLVVDTSASMRRSALWTQAIGSAEGVVDELHPADRLAVVAFDRQPSLVIGFEESDRLAGPQRREAVLDRLQSLQPTWQATDLGRALSFAAELAADDESVDGVEFEGGGDSAAPAAVGPGHLVLISDLQAGSQTDRLQAFAWPDEMQLDLRRVEAAQSTNAAVRILESGSTEAAAGDSPAEDSQIGDRSEAERKRVRVFNSPDAETAQFELAWGSAEGVPREGSAFPIQVPPGESRVMRMPAPEAEDASLVLRGDAHDFDNVQYFVQTERQRRTIPYLGPEEAEQPEDAEPPEDAEQPEDAEPREPAEDTDPTQGVSSRGLYYYLSRLPLDDAKRQVTVRPTAAADWDAAWDPEQVPLVVLARPLGSDGAERLKAYLEAGGRVLSVLTGPLRGDDAARTLQALSGDATLKVTEAEISDYAMLSRIDFRHRLFVSMSDPQFNDFSKIRFWSHRNVTSEDDRWTRAAMFDNGEPAVLERSVGEGTLTVLACGWHPEESQLALSTKFLPLMFGILGRNTTPSPSSFTVGGSVEAPSSTPSGARLRNPAGEWIDDDRDNDTDGIDSSAVLDRPGIYDWIDGDRQHQFAVNLDEAESRTEPLSEAMLERYGVSLGSAMSAAQRQQRARQLRDLELESQQKLWQWLLAAALLLLGLEAWLGGWLTGRSRGESDTTVSA